MKPPRSFLGFAAAAALLGGCTDITGVGRDLDAEASEPFSFELDAAASARLRLEGVNGSITIAGQAGAASVLVSGERRVRSDSPSDAADFLERVSVDVRRQGGEIVVRTLQPSNTDGRDVLVDYEVIVPPHLDVEIVDVNGDVQLRGLEGAIEVDHVNGSVDVKSVTEDVQVALVNGDIACDVTMLPGGVVRLSVVNGQVVLDLPTSTSASLEADATNGIVTVAALTVLDAVTSTNSVRGRLGAGDGQIDLDVVNGVITVRGHP